MSGLIIIQWIARAILLLLLGLSVWSVSIMIGRRRAFRNVGTANESEALKLKVKESNVEELRRYLDNRDDLGSRFLRCLLQRGDAPTERVARGFILEERTRLEEGLTVLATLGANAPFIGLFGTVLGIMHAFGELGVNQSGTSGVMTGISEALIATAVGLFVAIPAVVAYNLYSRRIRTAITECEILRELFLSRKAG